MSPPVSAMMTSAIRTLIPGMVTSSPQAAKGLDHHVDPGGELVDGVVVLVDHVRRSGRSEARNVAIVWLGLAGTRCLALRTAQDRCGTATACSMRTAPARSASEPCLNTGAWA